MEHYILSHSILFRILVTATILEGNSIFNSMKFFQERFFLTGYV